MPLHVSSTCAHHQEVKIAIDSLWYHHTHRCDDTRWWFLFCNKFISCLYMFRAHVPIIRRSKLHYPASGIITPTGVIIPDDDFCFPIRLFHASTCFGHMCSSSAWLRRHPTFIWQRLVQYNNIGHIWYSLMRKEQRWRIVSSFGFRRPALLRNPFFWAYQIFIHSKD